ncbi:hypothetical protein Lal_00019636, partial [Lupinus albus]
MENDKGIEPSNIPIVVWKILGEQYISWLTNLSVIQSSTQANKRKSRHTDEAEKENVVRLFEVDEEQSSFK